MKYFFVEGTFKDQLPLGKEDLSKVLEEHLNFLEEGFKEGWILVSGPKVAVGGGIIIMKSSSISEIENYLAKDPLKIAGVQQYRIVEFELHDCQAILKEWFDGNHSYNGE